ncbi:hypothetical protein EJB05_21612, partial [Eragrostis curvula]
MVDLLGVLTSVTPSVTIMEKNCTEIQKRTLQMMDTSGRSVEVTFWGNFCDVEDPNFPDAERLKQWYMTEGKAAACISLYQGTSNMGQNVVRKTIAQIKDENLGKSDIYMPDWITIKASILYIAPLMFNEKPCNKQATHVLTGCDIVEDVIRIQDHTGTTYVTAFQEAGEQIFGRPAKELFSIRNVNQDDALFTEIIEGARWHLYIFKLKVKEESYNDERHVKSSIVKAKKDGLGSSPSVQATVAPHVNFTSVLTSSNACTMNSCGVNQFGQQGTIDSGMSTPLHNQ